MSAEALRYISYPLDSGDGGLCDEECDGIPDIPQGFSLGLALPNPSRGVTKISYAVPWPGSRVSLQVFDINGRLMATLIDEHKMPGVFSTGWDGRISNGLRAAPGMYFIRMEGKDFRQSSKIILLK